ncbi:MAG TPA: (2Fe-2S)-binding protein [Gammaproteobacteria bacterium]|nr:(2Fe-2S)-binding protein [Gammaproteobacteria bacterium]
MFRLLGNDAPEFVEIELDAQRVSVPAGISLAAALLLLDALPTRRTPVGAGPRAPFCMMGACYECLVEIDGRVNQRACQVLISAGMRVRRQLASAVPEAEA